MAAQSSSSAPSLHDTSQSNRVNSVPLPISALQQSTIAKYSLTWQRVGTLQYLSGPLRSSSKIAAFDLDSTLIFNSRASSASSDCPGWRFFSASTAKTLQELYENSWKICIFSNQSGAGNNSKHPEFLKRKVESIVNLLNIPIQCFFACAKNPFDSYRKPASGMFSFFAQNCNERIPIDCEHSFFCGDAAGRTGDHDDSDVEFASNAGLRFFTPQDVFVLKQHLNSPKAISQNHSTNQIATGSTSRRKLSNHDCDDISYIPMPYKRAKPNQTQLQLSNKQMLSLTFPNIEDVSTLGNVSSLTSSSSHMSITSSATSSSAMSLSASALLPLFARSDQELVLFVGLPASGKSTYAQKHFSSYIIVNRDTLKNMKKCLQTCELSLEDGRSVIIDNTSPSPESRGKFIELGRRRGCPVRAFHFTATEGEARILNHLRVTITEGKRSAIPYIAYQVYKKSFVTPRLDEGFSELHTVRFVPEFQSEDHRNAYQSIRSKFNAM